MQTAHCPWNWWKQLPALAEGGYSDRGGGTGVPAGGALNNVLRLMYESV